MKYLTGIISLVILTVVFMSCGTSNRANKGLSFSSLEGEWWVYEMNGHVLDSGEQTPYLVFDMDQKVVFGYAGCNRLSGRIEYTPLQNHIIKFMQVITTRMACLDMSVEDEFLKTIDKVVHFDSPDSSTPIRTVNLYGTDGSKLLVLQKK
ncbi:MAG: META domain-containing protein [Tannerellaceae bacterium]|nr:META domain-containing protein [Tannerellaceae bacterium]